MYVYVCMHVCMYVCMLFYVYRYLSMYAHSHTCGTNPQLAHTGVLLAHLDARSALGDCKLQAKAVYEPQTPGRLMGVPIKYP